MSTTAEKAQEPQKMSGFSRRIGEFIDRIDYRKMETFEQLEQVYRLRYDAYRREEFIDVNAEKLCKDPLDSTDNHSIYGLFLDGKLVSSIRIHILDKYHRESPSSLIYSDKLDPLLDQGKRIVDPSRFTTDYKTSLEHRELPYATVRLASMASEYLNADYCLSLIRPEHAGFYKKVSLSKQIGQVRYYPKVNFPVVLYAAAKSTREDVWRRYPFFKAKAGEAEALFGPIVGAVRPRIDNKGQQLAV